MGECVAVGAEGHKPKLLEQVRDKLRRHHYSRRTEEAYIRLRRKQLRRDTSGAEEVEAFLTHLSVEGECGLTRCIGAGGQSGMDF